MPLKVIDLYCGLGGWSEGFLSEGYECVGYDIEAHDYGQGGYPGTLILRDVRSIHGSEFKDATCIVGSSPCQEFSYRAMPWKKAKALPPPSLGIELFNAQFRIQREASEAAGRHIPMVVENVRGAQKWVGKAQWHYGSFYLWGDVPALMPMTVSCTKNTGGSWFAIGGPGQTVTGANPTRNYPRDAGRKLPKEISDSIRRGVSPARWTNPSEHYFGVKQSGISGVRENGKGDRWFQDGAARPVSRSSSRKAASAMIAKIPFPLSQHIAKSFKPIQLTIEEVYGAIWV